MVSGDDATRPSETTTSIPDITWVTEVIVACTAGLRPRESSRSNSLALEVPLGDSSWTSLLNAVLALTSFFFSGCF